MIELKKGLSGFYFCVLFLVISCKKPGNYNEENSLLDKLSDGSSKTWMLRKLYLNDIQQPLNPGQAQYTKIYKSNFSWLDSDGYYGTYSIANNRIFTEVISNSNPPNTTITYKVNQYSDTLLEIEYTVAPQTYRLVYGKQ